MFCVKEHLCSQCQRMRERSIRERSLLPWWWWWGCSDGAAEQAKEGVERRGNVWASSWMTGRDPNLFDWGCWGRENKTRQKEKFVPCYQYPKGHGMLCTQKVVNMGWGGHGGGSRASDSQCEWQMDCEKYFYLIFTLHLTINNYVLNT